MFKKGIQIAIICTVLLFSVTPCEYSEACSYGPEWEDYRAVFFNPDLAGREVGLRPFYSTPHVFFDDIDEKDSKYPAFDDAHWLRYSNDQITSDYDRNCAEWSQFMGPEVQVEHIGDILYRVKADSFLSAYQVGKLTRTFRGNTFISAISQPAKKDALDYLVFAKKVELEQLHLGIDGWEENADLVDTNLNNYLDQSRRSIKQIIDPFLQQRWAFQALTLAYYQKDTDIAEMQRIYNRFFKETPQASILVPWAMIKIADVTEDSIAANYLYSRVFDLCQSRRVAAIQRFQSPWTESTLAFAKNNQEKATIIAMRAMQYPGQSLSDIEKIVDLDPKSPCLPLLITREVNKLEEWIFTNPLTGLDPRSTYDLDLDWNNPTRYQQQLNEWRLKNLEKDRVYANQVLAFLNRAAQLRTVYMLYKDLLYLANSNILFLLERPAEARIVLQKVQDQTHPRYAAQRTLTNVLLTGSLDDVSRLDVQNRLATDLQTLRQSASLQHHPERILSRVYLYLAHQFYKKGLVAEAGLFFNRSLLGTGTDRHYGSMEYALIQFYDQLATPDDIQQVLTMLQRKPTTALEQLLVSLFGPEEMADSYLIYWEDNQQPTPFPTKDQLLDLQGTIRFRNGDLKGAYASFLQVFPAFWSDNAYLSIDFVRTTKTYPVDKPTEQTANKAALVGRMLALEAEMQQNPAKVAENAYLLGNVWFECSYWGHGWMMFCYGKGSGGSASKPSPAHLSYQLSDRYDADYFHLAKSKAYYQKVLDARPDPELAARAMYMLAQCDRRERWLEASKDPESKLLPGAVASPLFRTWATNFKNTDCYKERVSTCAGLKDFLRK